MNIKLGKKSKNKKWIKRMGIWATHLTLASFYTLYLEGQPSLFVYLLRLLPRGTEVGFPVR